MKMTVEKKMATYTMQRMDAALLWLCLVGVGVSYYAYIVETTMEKDNSYQPYCDISEHVSCTKAFMSEYGKGFGLISADSQLYLPNSIYGIVYYTIVASLSLFNNYWVSTLMFIMSIVSNIFSIYLAYILYTLADVCILCLITYALNAFIMVLSMKKVREIKRVSTKKSKSK